MNRTWQHIFVAVALAAACATAASQDNVRLPDLGGTAPRVLPPDQERAFPAEFERYLRAQGLLIEDPMIRDYFKDMGYRLVAHSDKRATDFHFYLLAINDINAFAAPAGVIGLNAGLILAADTEHEVAGVVAHEIAHVTQDHLGRRMEQAQQVSLPIMLATLGLVIAGGLAGAGADASQGVLATGMGIAQQTQLNYSRQNESEADRIGIGLMQRAGYEPTGMVSFFERLNLVARAHGGGPPEYLRSHPLTTTRIAEARDRAENLPVRRERDSNEFHFVQARLRAQMETYPAAAVEYFASRLERNDDRSEAMRYGLALSLIRAGDLQAAEREVQTLIKDSPDRQIYRLLEADLRLSQGRVEESLDILADLYHQYAGSHQVSWQYAQALMHDNQPEHARRAAEILRNQLRQRPDEVRLNDLYARAADRSGDTVRAAEAVAESYYLRGNLIEAIDQLERLNKRDDLDYYQRARINARLDELRLEHIRHGGPRRG